MFTYFIDLIFSKFNNSWKSSKGFALLQKSSASKKPLPPSPVIIYVMTKL